MRIAHVLLVCAFVALATPATLAVGPVDGEFGTIWWANEFDSTGGTTAIDGEDGGAPGYRGELWLFDRYGFRAAVFNADLDDINAESSDYTSIDLLWKPLSFTKNNFIAVGAGWQDMDLQSIGLADGTSGLRLSAEGRIALAGLVYAYGQGSYFPDLDNSAAMIAADGTFQDLEGTEFEVGIAWKAFPFVNLRAGLRTTSVDFTRVTPAAERFEGEADTEGFFGGLSVTF